MDALNGKQFFANDGSFLERFKQLQEAKAASSQSPVDASKPSGNSSTESSTMAVKKTTLVPSSSSSRIKSLAAQTPAPAIPSSSVTGKLAFSLKQKPRPSVNALKLSDDEDGDDEASGDSDRQTKKQKLDKDSDDVHEINETIPAPPTDPEVKKIADKLACFIAKNGRQFENITRQKNPGDTPFRFLFDVSCPEYKYYEYRIAEEEKLLAESRVNQSNQSAGHNNATFHSPKYHSAKTGMRLHTSYQTPASALYVGNEVDSSGGSALASDSLAMMEFYVKKAAQEDMRKPAKYAEDEMPPPQCLETEIIVSTTAVPTSKRGHHMGDYIPQEELEKFLAKCNDAAAQKAAKEAAERAKIQADNVGHKLLSKMGWKEGEGLGSGNSGRADPVQAGTVKLNNLGVGAEQPGEVTPEDDIYEQYKKRMMLGYRFRPNPLNNPRKAYY